MQLCKAIIDPTSHFATPLKGDTLFGQMCWAIAYVKGKDYLEKLLADYAKNPFLVVSDAFPVGYLPKPKLPSDRLKEDPKKKKENRKKRWLSFENLQNGNFQAAKALEEDQIEIFVHNSINYQSFTTEGKEFAPYSTQEMKLGKKDIYFLIDIQKINIETLEKILEVVGEMGYGKDATIGKGRFVVENIDTLSISHSAKEFMALAPFDPFEIDVKEIFYDTFVRFGKLGADRAHTNPFKKPLVMADSAAVLIFDEEKELQYIGKSIENIATFEDVVHQGYAIVLPIGVER